jgi:uncharacterized protein involved in exopolysaccharide biosynthesis
MGHIQSIDEFIGLLIRRRLLIGAVAVFGMVMTLLFVMSKPDVFESAAVIQVQSPIVTDPTSGVQMPSQSAQRLQAIEQRLTTRENMLAVIERHGLYAGLPLSDDEKVHLLRISLRFQTVASAASPQFGAPPQVSALIIFAQAETRAKAARVANDFAQSILDAGAEVQTGRARESVEFFTRQQSDLRDQLTRMEAEFAVFKVQNAAALPAQRALREQELVGLETDLRALEQALVAARNERDAIVARQSQRITDRRQIEALNDQIATLDAQRAALETTRGEIRALLVQAPEVDRSLSAFERSLDQLQDQFEATTRRLAEARTAMDVEQRQQGESFTLLERAIEPDYPISGGRRKLAVVGAMASVLLGVGLAFLLDLLHPVLRTRVQVERELDLVPIVAIPPIRGIGASGVGLPGRLTDWLGARRPAAQKALSAKADWSSLPGKAGRFVGGVGMVANGAQAADLSPLGRAMAGSAVLLIVMLGVAVT